MTRGEKVIAFIERYCRVPEGAMVGAPLKLEPFQRRFVLDVYDNPHGTRRGIASIARKNGKSGLIAGLLLAALVGPEAKLNSQIVSGAMSRDQAALVFNLACKMVQLSPRLSGLVKIDLKPIRKWVYDKCLFHLLEEQTLSRVVRSNEDSDARRRKI